MVDKSALLDDLKIDRNADETSSQSRALRWVIAALVVIIVAGIGWLFLPLQSDKSVAEAFEVRTVAARTDAAQVSGESVLDATGYVVARRQATVSSKATGKVMEVLIEEGFQVAKGQLLATLDDSIPRAQFELAQARIEAAQSGLVEIQVALQQAQLDLDRTQGLARRSLARQADLDRDGLSVDALNARLERAQKEIVVSQRSMSVQQQLLNDMQIRAPFSGIVIAKAAQPGEMISPISAGGGFTRTGICTIVDMASLEVEVDVNESYINRVYADQPVNITLNAYPDHAFPAHVIAIIPAADRNKATVRVRVGFMQRDDRVLPDMGVRVAFLNDTIVEPNSEITEGVLVPSSALLEGSAEKNSVYVVDEGALRRRIVRLGEKQGGRIRVLTGLSEGARVVVPSQNIKLDDLTEGAPVQEM